MEQRPTEADIYSPSHKNIISDMLRNLHQLIVAVVRSEKLGAEVGDSSGTQRKGSVRRWEKLPSNG
jgi:hypothetical protein